MLSQLSRLSGANVIRHDDPDTPHVLAVLDDGRVVWIFDAVQNDNQRPFSGLNKTSKFA